MPISAFCCVSATKSWKSLWFQKQCWTDVSPRLLAHCGARKEVDRKAPRAKSTRTSAPRAIASSINPIKRDPLAFQLSGKRMKQELATCVFPRILTESLVKDLYTYLNRPRLGGSETKTR